MLSSGTPNPENLATSGDVIREINLARQDPALYAKYLEELRSHYEEKYVARSGHVRSRSKEGVRAVEEAIRFLRSMTPLPPLTVSAGLCRSAADHCADQAGGRFGHRGSDGSNPARRMSRYGVWGRAWAENVSYGKTTARNIVIQLIVDDGVAGRKHRKNIFDSNFGYAGAACGPHAVFGSVCNIDFAGTYAEASAVLARNN